MPIIVCPGCGTTVLTVRNGKLSTCVTCHPPTSVRRMIAADPPIASDGWIMDLIDTAIYRSVPDGLHYDVDERHGTAKDDDGYDITVVERIEVTIFFDPGVSPTAVDDKFAKSFRETMAFLLASQSPDPHQDPLIYSFEPEDDEDDEDD